MDITKHLLFGEILGFNYWELHETAHLIATMAKQEGLDAGKLERKDVPNNFFEDFQYIRLNVKISNVRIQYLIMIGEQMGRRNKFHINKRI